MPLRLNVSEEFFSDGLDVLEIAGVQFAEFGGGGFDFGGNLGCWQGCLVRRLFYKFKELLGDESSLGLNLENGLADTE